MRGGGEKEAEEEREVAKVSACGRCCFVEAYWQHTMRYKRSIQRCVCPSLVGRCFLSEAGQKITKSP